MTTSQAKSYRERKANGTCNETYHVVKNWSCLHRMKGMEVAYTICEDELVHMGVLSRLDDYGILFTSGTRNHFLPWVELKSIIIDTEK